MPYEVNIVNINISIHYITIPFVNVSDVLSTKSTDYNVNNSTKKYRNKVGTEFKFDFSPGPHSRGIWLQV